MNRKDGLVIGSVILVLLSALSAACGAPVLGAFFMLISMGVTTILVFQNPSHSLFGEVHHHYHYGSQEPHQPQPEPPKFTKVVEATERRVEDADGRAIQVRNVRMWN